MRHTGIIVAAGTGTRFGGNVPKQFLEAGGKPLLFYPLKAMQESFMDEIIVVTGRERIGYVQTEIVDMYGFSKVSHVVSGGSDRGHSVCEGLKVIDDPDNTYVYVHDGARPMLTQELLLRVKEGVTEHGAVLAAVPCKDTVKVVDAAEMVQDTPDRTMIRLAQTPQVFVASELYDAYERAYRNVAAGEGHVPTDDASVMEIYGHRTVYVVPGDYTNIKVTTPEDLEIVRSMLAKRNDL